MSRPDIAIIGGGLLGRTLAWRAALQGFRVELFDAGDRDGRASAAWVADGMIAPLSEAAEAPTALVEMGMRSLALWPEWISELSAPVHFDAAGTVIVWHRRDAGEGGRFESQLNLRLPHARYEQLDAARLSMLEPQLSGRFQQGCLMRDEAHIDNRQLLPALAEALDATGVICHWNQSVSAVEEIDADLRIDCRGRGAQKTWRELRCVRGEIARLHAPEVQLQHVVRLLHPQLSLYVIPRPGHHFVVGATAIEGDDSSPVSVRGALELLSGAYALVPEFGEARILELNSGCRPALPDNCPAIRVDASARLMEVNGLYRHGFLLTPAVIEKVLDLLPGHLRSPQSDLGEVCVPSLSQSTLGSVPWHSS